MRISWIELSIWLFGLISFWWTVIGGWNDDNGAEFKVDSRSVGWRGFDALTIVDCSNNDDDWFFSSCVKLFVLSAEFVKIEF